MGSPSNPAEKLAHVRPVRPLHFPSSEPWEEHLGQHPRHEDLCMLLKLVLRALCGEDNAVSADMFLYWNAGDSRYCRAPDAAVKLGLPMSTLVQHGSWKTWELGVPELVVEVLSLSDTPEKWTFQEKLDAYAQVGVREFLAFDLDAPEGKRIRVWDRIHGDFVERVVEGERTPCAVLSLAFAKNVEWGIVPFDRYPAALRLFDDGEIVLTEPEARVEAAEARADAERERAETERERAETERVRADAERARADARIAELEAKLREASRREP